MLPAQRRDLLLTRLERDGRLVAKDLAAELGVAEDSVRRDLRELAAAGLCQRVYGGALPVSPAVADYATRGGVATESKRRVAAAAALLEHPGAEVFVLGGRLFKHSAVTSGAAAVEAAQWVHADLFLLGVTGVHHETGLTTGDADEAAMKRALAARSADTYVLASSEKIGAASPFTVLPLSEVSGIVTDAPEDHPVLEGLRRGGTPVVMAD
jgi:DeoR/GlpR family transcriptional regulator of sugar metabolism